MSRKTPPHSDLPPLLSLAMIVKDGGQLFASLLQEARNWVDEMVIGDTGSEDASRQIAAVRGARVLDVPWTDDFAEARNTVLRECRGQFILVLDADEQVAPADWRHLRDWVADPQRVQQPVAASILTRNYLPGRHFKRGWLANPEPDPHALPQGNPAEGYVPTAKVRVFPNRKAIHFIGHLHETVESSLRNLGIPTVHLEWPVHHFGMLSDHQNSAQRESKNRKYLRLARRKASAHPHLPCAWAELADCAVACGEPEQALIAIERALVLMPLNPDYRLTAATILKEMGELQKARQQLVTAMNSGPVCDQTTADIAHLRAQILMLQGHPEQAGGDLDQALKLMPGNGYYLNTLGAWHLQCGRGKQAQLALQRAHVQNSTAVDPLLNLGLLHSASGQPDLAEQHYQRVLELDPENPRARKALARLEESAVEVG